MLQYLMDNNIIADCQHNFTTKKSCFPNLMEAFEDWTFAVDQRYEVCVIYLDYSKALIQCPSLQAYQEIVQVWL